MIISVIVKPNSKINKIKKLNNKDYKIWVKEKPKRNKANKAIILFLQKYFHTNKVDIISGLKSRKKYVKIG